MIVIPTISKMRVRKTHRAIAARAQPLAVGAFQIKQG
jgi:hypothetical protein